MTLATPPQAPPHQQRAFTGKVGAPLQDFQDVLTGVPHFSGTPGAFLSPATQHL
jgi:hypothetical protein